LHTLAAWRQSRVDRVIAVIRPDDEPLADLLRSAGVDLVVPPVAPPDMKASIGFGLAHVAQHHQPGANDSWLVAPADMPGLSARVIDALIAQAAAKPGRVLVPTLAGRRGHPVLLPWPLAAELPLLAEGAGLNQLIDGHDPLLVPCDAVEPDAAQAFADIDTPDDLKQFGD
jgi:molybdenum cofactor cytidylyltransferase